MFLPWRLHLHSNVTQLKFAPSSAIVVFVVVIPCFLVPDDFFCKCLFANPFRVYIELAVVNAIVIDKNEQGRCRNFQLWRRGPFHPLHGSQRQLLRLPVWSRRTWYLRL